MRAGKTLICCLFSMLFIAPLLLAQEQAKPKATASQESSDEKRDLEAFVFLVSKCAEKNLCPALYDAVVNTPSQNIILVRESARQQVWPKATDQAEWRGLLQNLGLPLPATAAPQNNTFIFFLDNVVDENALLGFDTLLLADSQTALSLYFGRKYYQYPIIKGDRRSYSETFKGKDLLAFWKGEEKPKTAEDGEILELELIARLASLSLVSRQLEIVWSKGSISPLGQKICHYCVSEFPAELIKKAKGEIMISANPNNPDAVKAEFQAKLKPWLEDLAEKQETRAKIEDCASALLDYWTQSLSRFYETSKKLKRGASGKAAVVPEEMLPYLENNSESKAIEYFVRRKMQGFYQTEENPVYGLYLKYWDKN